MIHIAYQIYIYFKTAWTSARSQVTQHKCLGLTSEWHAITRMVRVWSLRRENLQDSWLVLAEVYHMDTHSMRCGPNQPMVEAQKLPYPPR